MAKEKLNHSTSEGPQDLREETEQFNHEGWQMAARRVLRSYLPSSFNLDAMTDEQVVDLFYEFVGKPEIRERLPQYATLQDAVELIRKAKNIIVVSGAGVSVSCGIPDFRSENGVYARLRKDFPELPNPEAMFDIDFFRKNPKPFYQFAKELYPGNFNPSISHRFIKILEEQGKLLRNYTQNIDTLESIAGVKNVIECHGSFRTATCLNCGQNFGCDDIRDDVLAKKVAQCAVCGLGVVKPDIVFFGESLPELFHRSIDTDKDVADLLIVMGSSMKVQPVGLVPTSLPPEVPQILINRETLNCRSEFDVQLLGNCDIIVSHLCSLLGGRFKEQIQQEAKVDCDLTPIDAETFHNAVQQHTSHDTSFEGPAAKRPRLPELVTVGDVLKGTYVTAEPNATMFEGARTLYDTDAKAFIFNVSSASSSTTSVCSSDVIDVTSRCVSEPPRGNSQPQKYSRSVSAPPEFNNYDDDDALSTSSSPSTNSTITASSTASAGVQELQSSSTEAINHAQKDDAETFVVSQIHDENDDVISPSSICTSVPSSPRSDTDIFRVGVLLLTVMEWRFPKGFAWSCATSAYQVEGACDEKGQSVWDVFTHRPGNVIDGSNGDVACDSYHHLEEDVQLIAAIGVSHYRFSVAWSRVLPNGTINDVNEAGVRYYRQLCEKLVENNIEPVITLYHWDYPYELEKRGGWLHPDAIQWFCDYARLCFDKFGDLVKTWITFNEIWMCAWTGTVTTAGLSDQSADKASRERCARAIPYLVGHQMLLSHGRAYRIYENEFREKQKGQVGITMSAKWREPASDSPDDIRAAQDGLCWQLDWIAHPIFSTCGGYPKRMRDRLNDLSINEQRANKDSILPEFTDEECNVVRGSADFMGLNYYISYKTRHLTEEEKNSEELGWLFRDADYCDTVDPSWEKISGEKSWLHNTPWTLPKILCYIRNKYNNPKVLITENGCADHPEEVVLEDNARIKYCEDHLKALHKAITKDGCNVLGYTLWSLLDNFEWTNGYTMKFGMYHVDFNDPDLRRTPKKSVSWYADVIRNNGL